MTSVPTRKLPPLPPKRRAPIPPPVARDYEVRGETAAAPSSEISALDSGISESSSVSSLPLVTNSSVLSSSHDNVNNNFSKLSLESENYDSSDLSLPVDSSLREEKSDNFSRSPSLTQNSLRRPPVPPIRKDSIKSSRKTPKSVKLSFEEKFCFVHEVKLHLFVFINISVMTLCWQS